MPKGENAKTVVALSDLHEAFADRGLISSASVIEAVPEGARILMLDDDREAGSTLAECLSSDAYDVTALSDEESLRDGVVHRRPAAVVMDLTTKKGDGVEMMRSLAAARFVGPVFILNRGAERTAKSVERFGLARGLDIVGIFEKPQQMAELAVALKAAIALGVAANVRSFPNRPRGPAPTARRLAEAIDAGEIDVHYQAKVRFDEDGHRIVGAEALARWTDPERGPVSPATFIPLAESGGLIGRLTERVVDRTLEDVRALSVVGLHCPVSLNLSRRQTSDLDFPDYLEDRARSYGVAPGDVTVELTEQAIIRSRARSLDVLTRLHLKGFRIALDDFGVGYSSLSEIYRLPLDELKIDRSLVTDMETLKGAFDLLEAVAVVAGKLELSVCLEGVERAETAETLAAMGFEYAQGYFFGRPGPLAALQYALTAQAGEDALRAHRDDAGGRHVL